MTSERSLGPVLVWAVRAVWLALLVGLAAFGEALSDHSRPVQVVAAVGLWVGWAAVLLALLVPSTVSLTAARLLVPAAPVVAVWALLEGAGALAGWLTVAIGLLATVLVLAGEVGEEFAQASAYGDERRFLLRPPGPILPVLVVLWVVLAAAVLSGPLLLAAGAWVPGALVTVAAGAMAVVLARRFHRLSRRWLVLVPAGLVLHDHTVLAETAMFSRAEVRSCSLALADTEAADLTGGALGPAIELALAKLATVVLAPTPKHPGGRALHVRSMLVSPTRPGHALAALQSR